jgi:hypothetical protein
MKIKPYSSLNLILGVAGLAGCSPDRLPQQGSIVVVTALGNPTLPVVNARLSEASQERPPRATPYRRSVAASSVLVHRFSRPVALPGAIVIGQKNMIRANISWCGLIQPLAFQDATDSDLPTFCAQNAPQGQEFVVRPGRDTVLLGQQGTRLVIPKRAFDVPASSGAITLTVHEFYSTADIVLAGLSTRAGLDVLETGGMLHLNATANGQTVRLRPGKRLLVQLPTRQPLPGMNLYKGVSADSGHAPDWRLAGSGMVRAVPVAALRKDAGTTVGKQGDRWPSLPKGNGTLQPLLDQLVPLTAPDLAQIAQLKPADKNERRWWKTIGRNKRLSIKYIQHIALLADSTGTIQEALVQQGDSTLGKALSEAVKRLPQLRPASYLAWAAPHRRRCTAARGILQVLYTKDGQRLAHIDWQWLAKPDWPAEGYMQSRAVFAQQFTSASAPLTLDIGLYYELAAGGLGWINCDRLLDPGPRILYTVATPDPTTVVSLVFKGQRSILASSRTEGSAAIFEQVPSGQAAMVVALRREKGVTYLATSSVSLNQTAQPVLSFHPVTLAQLRTELAQL